MMPPQAAPPQPQKLEIRTVPAQRQQFKDFMQGMRQIPKQMPSVSMPQMPVNPSSIDMIDIFSQPVQFMARGGVLNRPIDEVEYTPANVKKQTSRLQEALKEREKKRDKKNKVKPITPQQEADARAALVGAAQTRAGSEDPSDYAQFVASARNRYRRPSSLSDQVSALSSVPANFGAEFGTNEMADSNIRNLLATGIGIDPVDRRRMDPDLTKSGIAATFLEPRNQSGLGNTLSQQIADLQGPANITRNLTGSQIDALNQSADLFSDENTDDGASLLAPNFLSRLPLVGDFFYKGQVQDATDFMSIPGASFDDVTGVGTAQVGKGTLTRSPSGVITYSGPRDASYTGPFANLINPRTRPEKDVFQAPKAVTDPCPDGFKLVDGVCQPIASQSTATQTPMITAAPTATTATPQVIVPSTRQSAPIQQVAPVAFPTDMISNLTKPFGMQEGGAVSDSLTAATDRFLESMRAVS